MSTTALGTGDGAIDTVTVEGTGGDDAVQVLGSGSSFSMVGLSAVVNATGSEGANDQLVVKGLGGDDTLDASALQASVVNNLTLDGGTGNDTILGSHGVDFLFGGDGNDFIDGNQGNDRAEMGAGDDVFQWDPGDGSDTVEGQDGFDTMLFNGANIDEKIDISANGSRLRFFRNVGSIVMDVNGTERVDFNALGGADMITVHDLSGTDVAEVNLNLAGADGAGDGAADTVIVNGTDGDDAIVVAGDASCISVTGLAAQVNITQTEAANDKLTIQALAGEDVVEADGLAADAIQFAADGGAGDDVLNGGGGQDVLDGGPGDNIVI